MQPSQAERLHAWHPAAPRLEAKPEYALGDLLRFDDSDFIDVAYRTLLHRDADAAGREGYLAALRGGLTSKVEILGHIRFSDEGRKCGVHVDGLLLPYKLHQWRHRKLVGPFLGFFMALARLSRLALRLQSMEARAARENHELGAAVNRLASEMRERLGGFGKIGSEAAVSAVTKEFAVFEHALGAPPVNSMSNDAATASEQVGQNSSVDAVRCRPAIDPAAFRNAVLSLTDDPRLSQLPSTSDTTASHAQHAALMIRQMLDARIRESEERALALGSGTRDDLTLLRGELLRKFDECADKSEVAHLGEIIAGVDDRSRELEAQQVSFAEQSALSELAGIVERIRKNIESNAPRMENHITAIKEVLAIKADAAQLAVLRGMLEDLRRLLKERHESAGRAIEVLQQNLLASRRELLHLQQRIERIANIPAGRLQREPTTAAMSEDPTAHALDSFYVALEDQFRGSSELISRRCETYLPVVQRAAERTEGGTILDIGCGRGEWLRILGEHGFDAYGIDLNEMMILECRAKGLDARELDAIEHLRGLADASMSAVTGMHIIEHVPFPSVVALFDEVRRVLKPGGVVVFETPNPENLDVGACSFYMDPTHLHPLPPPLIEFTAKARGFDEVEIRRLVDHRPALVPPETDNARPSASEPLQWLLDRARERLSAAPDYAVIAWKNL